MFAAQRSLWWEQFLYNTTLPVGRGGGDTGEITYKAISYLLTIPLKLTQMGKNIRNEGFSNEISLGEGTILNV